MKGKIFNAQEVQAIIAGNKTQFREVIKAQPNSEINPVYLKECNSWQWATKESRRECPYQVGQKIFVKESFLQKLGSTQLPSGEHETFFTGSNVEYVADGAQERWDNPDVFYPNWWKKRPAQHMKQEHSRLTLEITDVKVERLADISEEDCKKEGIGYTGGWNGEDYDDGEFYFGKLTESEDGMNWKNEMFEYPNLAFSTLWDTTHKKPEEKWEANPWVWVVDFKVNKRGGDICEENLPQGFRQIKDRNHFMYDTHIKRIPCNCGNSSPTLLSSVNIRTFLKESAYKFMCPECKKTPNETYITSNGASCDWNDLIDPSWREKSESTHKKPEEKFEANPWVWVVDFKINK